MTDMKITQDKILEIAVYFDTFCKEHNITYFMMGGSALGAIRHQGFIPWDDDYDVFMTYKNYQLFIEACEKSLDTNHFYFQKENTNEWPSFFSKIRMNGTTFIEEDTKERNMHKGFYIDVMCLNNTSDNTIYRYLQYVSARILNANVLAKRGYTTNNIFKKIIMYITDKFMTKTLKSFLLNTVRSLNSKDTNMVGHFFGRAKFINSSFPSNYLGEQRYVDFEEVSLPVPEKVEDYLSLRYGKDYMKLPNEKTRALYPSHAVFVDTNTDYRYYESKREGNY